MLRGTMNIASVKSIPDTRSINKLFDHELAIFLQKVAEESVRFSGRESSRISAWTFRHKYKEKREF